MSNCPAYVNCELQRRGKRGKASIFELEWKRFVASIGDCVQVPSVFPIQIPRKFRRFRLLVVVQNSVAVVLRDEEGGRRVCVWCDGEESQF